MAIRIPRKPKACCAFGTKTTLQVVSLKERQRKRIATPVCGLVRDDSSGRKLAEKNNIKDIAAFWTTDGRPYGWKRMRPVPAENMNNPFQNVKE